MKKQKSNIPFKNQLMLSYTMILAIILIIGVILYYISYCQVKNGINQQNRLTLSSSVTQLDYTLKLMNAAARQTSADIEFNGLSKMTGEEWEFYYRAYKTQTSLKSVTPVELLLPISNSFIYLKSSGYAISTIMFLDYDFYVTHNTTYQVEPKQLTEALLNSEYWNKFIPFGNISVPSRSFLYIQPLSASVIKTNADSVLCYEFDYDLLTEYFSDMNLYGDGYLVAYDKNGFQAFLLSEANVISGFDTLKNLDYKNQTASFTPGESHREMLVTSFISPYNNWTYYLVQPSDKAYYSILPYQRFFTAITIASFVIGGIIAGVFSSFGSRCLTQLTNELTVKESMATSLNLLVEKQKPVVIESYMRRIMEGSVTTDDEMGYIIGELSLDRPDTKYHVLYTEVSPAEDSMVRSDDLELCLQNYDMLVREALRRYYPDTGYIYKPSDRVFAVLIASPKSALCEQTIGRDRDVFIALHGELLEKYGIWISGGLGGRNSFISYTWKSYQQAKEAKSVTTIEKYILSWDSTHSSDVYYYPESLSVQLSGFISIGNKDQVNELFKLIKNENTEKRNLSYNQQRWLISDVRATVFKKRHNIAPEGLEPEKLKRLDLIDKEFEGEMSLDSLKNIALQLCDVCGSAGNELILKIQEYINNNYQDPNLCLTKISDEFGISENYFSYLFKKEVSENFSIYLERLRMAKAKEMIQESDISLSVLYQYLGYNNAATFRRVFKKNFGVSPKEMRDKINAK
ncbi:AraC family transcriptional regulator [Lachnospiraceae bacterium 54-53]